MTYALSIFIVVAILGVYSLTHTLGIAQHSLSIACAFFRPFFDVLNKILEGQKRIIAQTDAILALRAQVEEISIRFDAVREEGRLIGEPWRLISEEQMSIIEKQRLIIDRFVGASAVVLGEPPAGLGTKAGLSS